MNKREDIKRIEFAIEYLVKQYSKSGHNEKPVIFHSLRIAYKLIEFDYSAQIVIGAILHDLLEDSDVTQEDIENNFDVQTAKLVHSLSFNKDIKNTKEKYKDLFSRTLDCGFDAAIIKCVDLLDNSYYYSSLTVSKEKEHELIDKVGYFLDESRSLIGGEPIYKLLEERYSELKK